MTLSHDWWDGTRAFAQSWLLPLCPGLRSTCTYRSRLWRKDKETYKLVRDGWDQVTRWLEHNTGRGWTWSCYTLSPAAAGQCGTLTSQNTNGARNSFTNSEHKHKFNILYYLNLYLRLRMMRNGKLEIFLYIYLLFVSTIFLNCKKNFLNFPSRLKWIFKFSVNPKFRL